jgi:fructose-bisphosphate aldolase class 1
MPLIGQTQLSGTGTGSKQAQMNLQLLKDTAKVLFADHKGLLAMDESNGTFTLKRWRRNDRKQAQSGRK